MPVLHGWGLVLSGYWTGVACHASNCSPTHPHTHTQFYLPPGRPLPPLLISEAASRAVAAQPLPPPSPARSLLGTSPPGHSFHREYGWTAGGGGGG